MKSPDYSLERHNEEQKERNAIEEIKLPEFIQYREKTDLAPEDKSFIKNKLMNKYGITEYEASTYVEYARNLGINYKDFIDESVLDIGSGSGQFKNALEKMDVKDTKIVNLDEGTFWKKEMDVVGMAETLPFKNESFNIVLAHCSVPIMDVSTKKHPELIPVMLREALRVVKVGGRIKIYPIGSYREDEVEVNRRNAEMFRKILEELGYIYEENPKLIFKITKINETGGDYGYSLEIKK